MSNASITKKKALHFNDYLMFFLIVVGIVLVWTFRGPVIIGWSKLTQFYDHIYQLIIKALTLDKTAINQLVELTIWIGILIWEGIVATYLIAFSKMMAIPILLELMNGIRKKYSWAQSLYNFLMTRGKELMSNWWIKFRQISVKRQSGWAVVFVLYLPVIIIWLLLKKVVYTWIYKKVFEFVLQKSGKKVIKAVGVTRLLKKSPRIHKYLAKMYPHLLVDNSVKKTSWVVDGMRINITQELSKKGPDHIAVVTVEGLDLGIVTARLDQSLEREVVYA